MLSLLIIKKTIYFNKSKIKTLGKNWMGSPTWSIIDTEKSTGVLHVNRIIVQIEHESGMLYWHYCLCALLVWTERLAPLIQTIRMGPNCFMSKSINWHVLTVAFCLSFVVWSHLCLIWSDLIELELLIYYYIWKSIPSFLLAFKALIKLIKHFLRT